MAPRKRRRREYLQLLDVAKAASEVAVDSFNRSRNPYRDESTLIMLTNAWELLAKAVLVRQKKPIVAGAKGQTISAEKAVFQLGKLDVLTASQVATIQQVVSLRNAAAHHLLPPVPEELMHHLLFYSCKFFREVVAGQFPQHVKDLPANSLSLSFGDMTTYADKVQKAVSRVRRNDDDRKLVWLLERGIAFDGGSYLTEKQVEAKYRNKSRILPNLALGEFVRTTDMVRIVPIEAPKNFTADIKLRKGKPSDSSLPVVMRKTDVEADYPYLTKDVAKLIDRNVSWVSKATTLLGLRLDDRYHQRIRSSDSTYVQRYSEAAVQALRAKLASDQAFNPYNGN